MSRAGGKLIGDNVSFVDGTPATTAPRAMFYFGWYSYNKYYDIYDWLPGTSFLEQKFRELKLRSNSGSYASDLDSINFGYSVRNHFYSVFGTQSLYHGGKKGLQKKLKLIRIQSDYGGWSR